VAPLINPGAGFDFSHHLDYKIFLPVAQVNPTTFQKSLRALWVYY
jgi:hypothetical protein